MKIFINQAQFLKAVEYTSEKFFSKPYSISPMVDRWFNQLAMVELEGKRNPIHLSSEIAREHVDIILDGKSVSKADIDLIFKFHSQQSTHDKDRIALEKQNEVLDENKLALDREMMALKQKDPNNEDVKKELNELNERILAYDLERANTQTLEVFDADKLHAKELYKAIVERGLSQLNVDSFESKYKQKIKNIVYRPNHGLAHSVRAAYSITAIQTYRTEHGKGKKLEDSDLEKLQLMMLFSVVGRKDETGFADTGNNKTGCVTYQGFRTTSGREYLNYIEANAKHLYKDLESRYRDAIVVELMGYSNIDEAIERGKIPEILLDYVIKQESLDGREINRDKALILAQMNTKYNLAQFFPESEIRAKASDMLDMMNDAHGLDLTRCYPLYPSKNTGPKSVNVLSYHLAQSGFIKEPSIERLASFFKFMRTSFDTMALTGQQTMFGMLSEKEFETQKTDIFNQIKTISDYCNNPDNQALLLIKARIANASDNTDDYFSSGRTRADLLLSDYREYLIVRALTERLTGIVENYLEQSALLQFKEDASGKQLDVFFKLMSSSYNILPGKTILSQDKYNDKKAAILAEMKVISDDCKNSLRFADLVAEAKLAKDASDNPFTSKAANDKDLLKDYRNFLIAKAVVKSLTGEELKESLKSRLTSDHCMFQFQQVKGYDFTAIDHHQNAVKVVQSLQTVTPYSGVFKADLPVVLNVKHDRTHNKTNLTFETYEQAKSFQNTYQALFGHDVTISSQGSQIAIEVNRAHYKQLLAEQLIEFKQVEVPKKVERNDYLIDQSGRIDALSLIDHSRGLGRLVSTTALGGESFPDYDYLFRAYDDPVHQRYTAPMIYLPKYSVDYKRYRDPRSGQIHARTVVTTSLPDLRFQEPVTQPQKFQDKLDDGWTVSVKGGQPKNTKYTTKLAHTLLPSHGMVDPFSGYRHKARIYFPIGVLSDIEQVDLKEERYVWAQNMSTYTKFWIRNPSEFNRGIFLLLDADFDNDNKEVRRYASNVAKLDLEHVKKKISGKSKDTLVQYLQCKAKKFVSEMDEKFYHPTDENLADFKRLIKQQQQAYLNVVLEGVVKNTAEYKERQKEVREIFSGMMNRVDEEALRKGLKYSMTIRELIKHQNEQYLKNPDAHPHNEILASNTKDATRALYASKDELFYRLNLALHAMKIKEKYGYDVPLLVLSQNKAPYHYTEAMIKKDLRKAQELIIQGKFEYDRTLCKVYELDAQGNPIKVKLNERGKEIQEPKSIQLQQEILVDLFRIGMPELKDFKELASGQMGKKKMGEEDRDRVIDAIVTKMDVIGGLKRETQRMKQIFSKPDVSEREQFFLRAAALGHQSLVETMFAREDFQPSLKLLEKAKAFSEKNGHTALKDYLIESYATYKERICQKNVQVLPEMLQIIADNPSYRDPYDQMIASGQSVKLYELVEAHKRFKEGDETVLPNIMKLTAAYGWNDANNYMVMQELNPQLAKEFLADRLNTLGKLQVLLKADASIPKLRQQYEAGANDETLKALLKDEANLFEVKALLKEGNNQAENKLIECNQLLEEIKKASLTKEGKVEDKYTQNYYDAMKSYLEATKGNLAVLQIQLEKIKLVHQAVTSQEMKYVCEAINDFEKRAKNNWFTVGNQKKANRIRVALCNVPLLERKNVFSDENNEHCQQVRIALASHRISKASIHDKNNNVIEASAAKKFQEFKEAIAKAKENSTEEDDNNLKKNIHKI